MKTLVSTLLVSLLWVSVASAQVVVSIRASVAETTEPSPNIRVQPGEFVISRGDNNTPILDSLQVRLEYSGTATPGRDYAELPQFVTIPAGALSTRLSVEPRDDDDVEQDETVIATLALPANTPGYTIAPDRRQARVVIHDSDALPPEAPVVSLVTQNARTAEPCPVCFVAPAVLVFQRTGSTERALPVYVHTDGTAAPELDYPPLPNRFEIPAGAARLEVQLMPKDDLLAEGPEVVRLRLLEPPTSPDSIPYRVNPDFNRALVVILDDEPEAPKARLDFLSPREGAHFPLGTVIELTVIGVYTEGEIDHGVSFFDGDHLIGSTPPLVLNRAPIPGLPSVHIIRWENALAGAHTLTAKSEIVAAPIQGAPPPVAGVVVSPPLHISVGEEPPRNSVCIEATQSIAEETSAPLRRLRLNGLFTITRTGSTEQSQNVWVLYSGTSTPDVDYSPLPGLVTIPAGAASVEILVEATPDDLAEPIETLTATLSNCPPPPIKAPCYEFPIDPAHAQATVFIRDDGITQASLEIVRPEEGTHFEAGQTVPIVAVAIDLEGYISRVEFWANDQRIGVSELHFFRAPDPGTPITHEFAWRGAPPGEHVLTARVPRANDHALISQPVRIVVGETPAERVRIEIVSTDALAREPAANNMSDPAVFTVRRVSGPLNVALSVAYRVEGTATAGEDYEALSGTLLLPAGERSAELVVRPRADTVVEQAESVIVHIVPLPCFSPPPPDCYLLGEHDTAGALIFDSSSEHQMPRAMITRPAQQQVFENGADVDIRVEAFDPDGYIRRVEFFADGQVIGQLVIDFFREPDPGQRQVFEFVWEHPAPGPHHLTARVTDNNELTGTTPAVEILVRSGEALPIVAVAVLDAFAQEPTENNQRNTATFGIVRFGASSTPLEVSYSLAGTAENSVDYGRLEGRVIIPAGSETAVVTVVPLPDGQVEGIESVILRLNESSHYQLAASRRAQAVIADANLTRPNAHCVVLGDGARYVCLSGETGRRFCLQASQNLTAWETIYEGTGVDGAVHFVDESNTGQHCRFYRLMPLETSFVTGGIYSREEAILRLELQRTVIDASNIPMPPLPPTPINPNPIDPDAGPDE